MHFSFIADLQCASISCLSAIHMSMWFSGREPAVEGNTTCQGKPILSRLPTPLASSPLAADALVPLREGGIRIQFFFSLFFLFASFPYFCRDIEGINHLAIYPSIRSPQTWASIPHMHMQISRSYVLVTCLWSDGKKMSPHQAKKKGGELSLTFPAKTFKTFMPASYRDEDEGQKLNTLSWSWFEMLWPLRWVPGTVGGFRKTAVDAWQSLRLKDACVEGVTSNSTVWSPTWTQCFTGTDPEC